MARAKLTDKDREEIRALVEAGESLVSIKARFDISYTTIYRILDPEKAAADAEQAKQYQKENRRRLYENNKENTRRYSFVINKERDPMVINRLDAQDNISEYIRGLVIDDIEKDNE